MKGKCMKIEKQNLIIQLIKNGDQTRIHPDHFHTVYEVLDAAAAAGHVLKVEHLNEIVAFRSVHSAMGETILSINTATSETLYFAPYSFKILGESLNLHISFQK